MKSISLPSGPSNSEMSVRKKKEKARSSLEFSGVIYGSLCFWQIKPMVHLPSHLPPLPKLTKTCRIKKDLTLASELHPELPHAALVPWSKRWLGSIPHCCKMSRAMGLGLGFLCPENFWCEFQQDTPKSPSGSGFVFYLLSWSYIFRNCPF